MHSVITRYFCKISIDLIIENVYIGKVMIIRYITLYKGEENYESIKLN